MTERQTICIQPWLCSIYFLRNKLNECVSLTKMIGIIANDSIWVYEWKSNFGKIVTSPHETGCFSKLQIFLRKHWPCQQIIFSCFITKYAGHWRSYKNQWASIFKWLTHDVTRLTAWVKDSPKVQDRRVSVDVTQLREHDIHFRFHIATHL